MLVAVWLCGALILAIRFWLAWAKMNAVKRRARPFALAADVPALSSSALIEPGIFGVIRPVLLLPEGIPERLSAEQMRAILVHEMCHVRRRDNLTFAIHMVVETLFWFHPMVWWIGSRLIEERERACDQAVVQAGSKAQVYAEGILNICKFYVETPLNCVSGVTGADLKKRIMRIMAGQSVRKLGVKRKALLALACVLAVLIPVTSGVVHAAQGQTQPAGAAKKAGITGTWQGTLHAPGGHNLRTVLKVTKDDKDALHAMFYSLDQNRSPIAGTVSFEGGKLRFVNNFPGLTFEGKVLADGNSISGIVKQFGKHSGFPLVLERATPGTEWATPTPPPQISPMAAKAKPGIEVAIVKPARPGTRFAELQWHGGHYVIRNISLNYLMEYAYDLPERQIIGEPGWMSTDKWDIEAKPDRPGTPSIAQTRVIVQKVLAQRFALKFHEEKREMMGYILTIGKNGSKMKRTANPSLSPIFSVNPRGVIGAQSATMGDFAHLLQSAILGQPVVDQTGLQGRWDFTLKWTPDDSQFTVGPGSRPILPAADDLNAPPPLFTAIQEQLDLKLEAQKTQASVLVIDHVEQPSPN